MKVFDWGAMILIAQTQWGTLFCKIFGFSLTTLRFSVLVLGAAGIIFYYLLALKISRKEFTAFFSSLVIAFNPLYFSLSNSFMTDVPFLVCLMGATYYYSLYFANDKTKYIFPALFFLLAATMIRQIGVLMAISLVVAHRYMYPARWKRLILVLWISGMVIIILWGVTFFLSEKHLLPAAYGKISDLFRNWNWTEKISGIIPRTCQLFMYSSLLLFPLFIVFLPSVWGGTYPPARRIILVLSLLLALPVFLHRGEFPTENYIYDFGLGPRILMDTVQGLNWRPNLAHQSLSAIWIWGVLCTFFIFMVLLLSSVAARRKDLAMTANPIKVISIVFLIFYTGFSLVNVFFYDRYILPFIIFLSFVCIRHAQKIPAWIRIVSLVVFTGIVFYSVTATHDSFAFNRARWNGLNNLIRKGVSPKIIDGGFEFNGWYETGPADKRGKSWYFVNDDYYAVTLGPFPGYKKYAKYTYPSFLTFSTDSVMILYRSPSYSDSTEITCDAESVNEDKTYFLSSVPGILFANAQSRTDRESRSGKYSLFLDAEHPYGYTVNLQGVMAGDKFRVSVWTKNNEGKAGIIITAPDPKYLYFQGKGPGQGTGGWQQMMLEGIIFQGYTGKSISIYLWNYGNGRVYFDDIVIKWYKKMY